MYLNYFGLSEKPFSISPDPRFLYLSDKHRDGLAHLLYGTDEAGSFVLLTGEVGTGKTTLCRRMLSQAPEGVTFALILNPLQTPQELLASICDEFQVDYDKQSSSRKHLIDNLNTWLLGNHASGDRAVVIIDEAQNLNAETLEQVRLLTNLETDSEKLLKIILIGQPELREILNRPELRQLNQRITARYHLESLSLEETHSYLHHRLKIAGATGSLFKPAAIKKLHRISGGIPRIMNLIGDRALTGTYGAQKQIVDAKMLQLAASEVFNQPQSLLLNRSVLAMIGGGMVALLLGSLIWNHFQSNSRDISPTTTVTAPPVEVEQKSSLSVPLINEVTSSNIADAEIEPLVAAKLPQAKPASIQILTGQQLIQRLDSSIDSNAAFETIFDIWGFDFNALKGGSACERAQQAGMQCLYAEGKLDEVIEYNLPTVLEITSRGGQLNQLVLKRILGDQLLLQIGDEESLVHTADLLSYWNGSYLLLWPSPPERKTTIRPGSLGPTVVWLRRQLDLAEGLTDAVGQYQNFYNQELKQRIMRFQVNHHLEPDGIAGEKTLIRLASAVRYGNVNVPVLAE
jgi:general secretion pathway protein A